MSIKKDIMSWSKEVLEVPNPHLGGLPACPYAREAWKNDKVDVIETDDLVLDTLEWASLFWYTEKDVLIVASFFLPEMEVFDSFVEELNDKMGEAFDLHFMGFHPDFGAEDKELDFLYDHEWESEIPDEYCMVFIQSLSKVVAASDKLEKLGYYEAYPEEEYEALVAERKRKLYNGDETPCNEKENGPWRHDGQEQKRYGSRWHD